VGCGRRFESVLKRLGNCGQRLALGTGSAAINLVPSHLDPAVNAQLGSNRMLKNAVYAAIWA
jgi:hypothetical protein